LIEKNKRKNKLMKKVDAFDVVFKEIKKRVSRL